MSAILDRLAGLSPERRELFELLLLREVLADGAGAPKEEVVGRPRTEPVSSGQRRLWLQSRFDLGGAALNTASTMRLSGPLEPGPLRHALDEVVRRHEALRTTFAERDGEPVQVIGGPTPAALPVVDLAGLPSETREMELRSVAGGEAGRPLDLARGPLFRLCLLRLGERDHALVVVMHHIISDAWSLGVFTRELAALYAAFAAGRPSPLPELPVQYAGFARWQRAWEESEEAGRQLAWWRQRLAGAPDVLEIPTDRPRSAARRLRSGTMVRQIPPEPSRAMAELCRRRGATLFMGLLAVFELLLHARTGQADFLVGVDIANRDRLDTEALIGFFVNQLALRADLSGDPSFGELLERAREAALGAYAHQDLPFDRVVEALRPRRSPGRNPLIQVMFSQYNVPDILPSLEGLELHPLDLGGGAAIYDLNLYFLDTPDGLQGVLRYDADLFEPATAARWLEEYEALLGWALASPGARASELEERLAAERRRTEAAGLGQARRKVLQAARRRGAGPARSGNG